MLFGFVVFPHLRPCHRYMNVSRERERERGREGATERRLCMRDIRGLVILLCQVHRSPNLFAPHFYENFGHPKSNHQRYPRHTRTNTSYHSLNFHHKPPTSAQKELMSWEPKEPKEGNKEFEIGISSKMTSEGMLLGASGWLLIHRGFINSLFKNSSLRYKNTDRSAPTSAHPL